MTGGKGSASRSERNRLGDRHEFGNMINCRCHRLVAWLGLAVER
jgi:hypothetical protein